MLNSVDLVKKKNLSKYLSDSIISNNALLNIKIDDLKDYLNDTGLVRVLITVLNKFIILMKEYELVDSLDNIDQIFKFNVFL